MQNIYINVVVLCTNAEGSPEFVRVILSTTHQGIIEGDHYDKAKSLVEDLGYEGPFIAFDNTDTAAKQLGWTIIEKLSAAVDESVTT